jgi:hypothetical protein
MRIGSVGDVHEAAVEVFAIVSTSGYILIGPLEI